MNESFPPDRFDSDTKNSGRVGVHRAPVSATRRLMPLAWAALATVVLAALGIGAVVVIDNNIFSGAQDIAPSPAPTVAPTVDPSVPLTVLNGTTTPELAMSASDELVAAGFTVASTANASEDTIEETFVYYSNDTLKGVALGVAEALGVEGIRESDAFDDIGSLVTVVLGADYQPTPVP